MLIYGIHVPQHAASNDSIRISFSLANTKSCTSKETIIEESFPANSTIRFSATSIPISNFCPPATAIAPPLPFVYIVPAFHGTPYTVQFAEPDAADSVRVIPAQ
jgi:hypothetical protein